MPRLCLSILLSLLLLITLNETVNAQVVINEVFPNPSGDEKQDEWVELLNTGNQDIDLAGYKLKDAADHELIIDTAFVDNATTILASGWLVIRRNGHNSFSLNNTGPETIGLYDTSSSDVINTFTYNDSDTDRSWGRIPDGDSIYSETLDPTPGYANQSPPAPTNSPTPTNKPTSTPIPTSVPNAPTVKKTPTPPPAGGPTIKAAATKKVVPTQSSAAIKQGEDSDEVILGLRNQLSITPTENPGEESNRKFPFPAILMIVGGIIFMGAAGYPFLKDKIKRYNASSEKIS